MVSVTTDSIRTPSRAAWLPSAVVLLLTGCPGDDTAADGSSGSTGEATGSTSVGPATLDSGSSSEPGGTGSSGDTSNSGTSSSSGGTDTSTTMESTGFGSSSTGAEESSSSGEPDTSCNAIDFLFVVDDSGSRAEEQAALIASFPAFIAGIEASLMQADSLHVGVVTTDAYVYNAPGCNVLGGLVTQTGGMSSSNMACGPYADGSNFMTEQDDLSTAFSCAAQVGTAGNGVERPMDAMREAIGPTLAMPGACNEGFLRDDALLVVVIITDEWDGPNDPEVPGSMGTPADWYDDVVAAKGGIPEHVVVLSLINDFGGPCPPSSSAYDGVHIAAFTQMFGTQGIVGGICEADWSPAFDQTLLAVQTACENFGGAP